MYSKSIDNLISTFSRLPSVGPRTAERFVFHLLKSGKKEVTELILALKQLGTTVKSCTVCWDFSDESPCIICKNTSRDESMLCMVAEPQDVHVLEKTGVFKGKYYVLRGTISPDTDPSDPALKIRELATRVQDTKIKEVILAFNPDITGETTMMFLAKQLRELRPDLKVTRLARGLPMGSDLQYADDITLGSALKNRTKN